MRKKRKREGRERHDPLPFTLTLSLFPDSLVDTVDTCFYYDYTHDTIS